MSKLKKIFIAGGAGFIGSHLSHSFTELGHEVMVYDGNIQYFYPASKLSIKSINYRQNILLKDCKIVRGSTLDISDLRRNIIEFKPDYIINLAALPLAVTAVKNSEEAFKSILNSTHNFMEILRDINFCSKYVHISSSMVYGDFQSNPNPEDASKNPKEIYGSIKLASEYIVKGYAQRYAINTAIIRPSAVYGPTDCNYRVLQIFLEAAINNQEIIANNPESNFLDFTYVKDIALGINKITLNETANMECFNVTYGNARSLNDVLNILNSHFKNLKFKVTNKSGFYPKRGTLDISKAKKIVDFKPQYNLEDGIREYIDFLKS